MDQNKIQEQLLIEEIEKYMRYRDRFGKPYGYLKYYNNRFMQYAFQRIRKHKNICRLIYPSLRKEEDSFFKDCYRHDAYQFIDDMLPRRDEFIRFRDDYDKIVQLLQDDYSVKTLIGIMNAALTLRYEWYEKICVVGNHTDYYPIDIMPPEKMAKKLLLIVEVVMAILRENL